MICSGNEAERGGGREIELEVLDSCSGIVKVLPPYVLGLYFAERLVFLVGRPSLWSIFFCDSRSTVPEASVL